ncbi:DUF6588 family protein [Portibacter marinus]|uniref:DUF6588 family protein n=1 Tax=Portibacter marinus TaxID=2898660 RepID=UPI001F245A40|nr:DUF6588 family protein [Portibacter marinus]
MRTLYILLMVCCCLALKAQFTIGDQVSYEFATSDLGKKYFEPISQVYSSLLHSGVFPRYSEEGFHIKIGAHVTRYPVYSGLRTYAASDEITDAPTLIGPEEPISMDNGVSLPGGSDVDNITLGIPELYIGTLLGTDFYGRYLQLPVEGNLGRLELYGGGIRHDFGRYFLPEYVKWYLSYSYHQLHVGESVNAVNQYGLTQLGVKLNRIGFYGLFGYEYNRSELTYDFSGGPNDHTWTVNIDDEIPIRYGGGFNLTFKHVDLYGEYNVNEPIVLLLGFSVGI